MGCGLCIDAAVHFDLIGQLVGICIGTQRLDLFHHIPEKRLTAESGFHCHHKHNFHLCQIGYRLFPGRSRFQHDACFCAGIVYRSDGRRRVTVAFNVKGHQVCTGIHKLLHIANGVGDHQMHIQKQVCAVVYCRQNRHTKCNIRNKLPIHYIKVQHIQTIPFQSLCHSGQICHVCTQDRGRNFYFFQKRNAPLPASAALFPVSGHTAISYFLLYNKSGGSSIAFSGNGTFFYRADVSVSPRFFQKLDKIPGIRYN